MTHIGAPCVLASHPPSAPRRRVPSPLAAPALLLEQAQLDASDLAAARLRQRLDELDLARVLVRRRHPLAVLLQSADEVVVPGEAGPKDDERLHDLSSVRVRLAD